jgi:hypothetical protein
LISDLDCPDLTTPTGSGTTHGSPADQSTHGIEEWGNGSPADQSTDDTETTQEGGNVEQGALPSGGGQIQNLEPGTEVCQKKDFSDQLESPGVVQLSENKSPATDELSLKASTDKTLEHPVDAFDPIRYCSMNLNYQKVFKTIFYYRIVEKHTGLVSSKGIINRFNVICIN